MTWTFPAENIKKMWWKYSDGHNWEVTCRVENHLIHTVHQSNQQYIHIACKITAENWVILSTDQNLSLSKENVHLTSFRAECKANGQETVLPWLTHLGALSTILARIGNTQTTHWKKNNFMTQSVVLLNLVTFLGLWRVVQVNKTKNTTFTEFTSPSCRTFTLSEVGSKWKPIVWQKGCDYESIHWR